MSLWPLLIPATTSVLFVVFMVGLGRGWWFTRPDPTVDSIDEHRRFLNTLGGDR